MSRLLNDLPEDLIFDSFFLHAILRRLDRLNFDLVLPHHGDQRLRYNEALKLCNGLMEGTGQPAYHHACRKCLHIYSDESGTQSMLQLYTLKAPALILLQSRIYHSCRDRWCHVRSLLLSYKGLSDPAIEHQGSVLPCTLLVIYDLLSDRLLVSTSARPSYLPSSPGPRAKTSRRHLTCTAVSQIQTHRSVSVKL